MAAALERTGRSWRLLDRNARSHDPRLCGYCNGGCQQGEKQSTLVTYLQDAADVGARFMVGCRAERIRVRAGRADGVEAVWTGAGGVARDVTVRAETVVVAGGGIESPALLLRSGIGGPAVGENLKLHPAWFVGGVHGDLVDAWTGQIQSLTSLDFRVLPHGGGFLPECVILNLAFWTSAMPWEDGVAHKRRALELSRTSSWHAVTRDRGSGRVVLGPGARAVVQWELQDPRDLETARIANVELARLQEAAGAHSVFTFDPPGLRWVRERNRSRAFSTDCETWTGGGRSPTRRTRCPAHAWAPIRRPPSPMVEAVCTTCRASGSAMPRRYQIRPASTP